MKLTKAKFLLVSAFDAYSSRKVHAIYFLEKVHIRKLTVYLFQMGK